MNTKKVVADFSDTISAKISLSEMVVDEEYQGHVNSALVTKIARQWDDSAAGAVILNLRDDNTYAVLDGQHRVLAGKMCGITELNALVFIGKTKREEAKLFVQLNTKHNVRPFDRFRANMAAGESREAQVVKLLAEFGLTVSNNPHNTRAVRSVQALLFLYENYGLPHMRTVLGVLQAAFDAYDDRNSYNEMTILGMSAFLSRYPEVPIVKLIDRLKKHSPTTLRGLAYQRATGKTYWMEWGRVITGVYNKGTRVGTKGYLPPSRWDHVKYSPAGKTKTKVSRAISIKKAQTANRLRAAAKENK